MTLSFTIATSYYLYVSNKIYEDSVGFIYWSEKSDTRTYCPYCKDIIHGASTKEAMNMLLKSNNELYCLKCVCAYLNEHAKELDFCKLLPDLNIEFSNIEGEK